jgi:hypothetical protein
MGSLARQSILGVALAICVLPSPARGESRWRAAFPAGALETHLPSTHVEVLVAASAQPGSLAAAEALRAVLAGCAGIQRATLATPRADLTDDAARIAWTVRRASGEIVLYARVERDGSGEPSAVVSIFDREGRSLGAFVASVSEPLRAQRSASPAEGLGRAAVTSVDAVLTGPSVSNSSPTDPSPLPKPVIVIPRDADGHPRLEEAYAQYPGWRGGHAYREPVTGERLYQSLDRPDLADAYVARQHARYGLIATGSVVLGLGLLVGGSTTIAGGLAYSGSGSDHDRAFLLGSGIALGTSVGVGIAFILGGKFMPKHPISGGRLDRLADHHRPPRPATDEDGGAIGGSAGGAR